LCGNLLSDIALIQFLLELVASIDELAKARLRDQSALEVLFMHLGARRVLVGLRHLQAAGEESQKGFKYSPPAEVEQRVATRALHGPFRSPSQVLSKAGFGI
jgi:hypothetical protein